MIRISSYHPYRMCYNVGISHEPTNGTSNYENLNHEICQFEQGGIRANDKIWTTDTAVKKIALVFFNGVIILFCLFGI